MRRHAPWRRLLPDVCTRAASPLLLCVGGGPPGTTAPSGGTFAVGGALPTVSQNFYDMSDFEKDFAVRCFEYLTVRGDTVPSAACRAVLQAPVVPPWDATAAASWQPFFDLVLLPSGGVCHGWFRQHPLDDVWIRYATTYVADLWCRTPDALWLMYREQLNKATFATTNHRDRQLQLYRRSAVMTAATIDEDFHRIAHAVRASAHTLPLEDQVLQLSTAERATLADVRDVMEQVTPQVETLSTGSAAALLRLLVSTYGLYGNTGNSALVEELRTAARHVCKLAGDSRTHSLLTWAAALIGGGRGAREGESATAAAAVSQREDESLAALLTALACSVHPSATHRGAVLREQTESFVLPLSSALASEEAFVLDVVAPTFSSFVNAEDVAAAAETAASAAAMRDAPSSVRGRCGVAESEDCAYFTSVLEGDACTRVEDPDALSAVAQQRFLPDASYAWLPGAGVDVHGCWCVALTHSALLVSQAQLHRHHHRGSAVDAWVKTVEQTHQMFRVSLMRRCSYLTTPTNMWSKYSLLTHLVSVTVQLPVSVTLLHLTSSKDAEDEAALAVQDTSPLLGLLFLFPTLELRSFYGGSTSLFSAGLSSGTLSFPCYLENPARGSPSVETHVETVRVPARLAAALSRQLDGRDSAVVCFVQSGLAVKDVFLLEELHSHLRHIVVN